MTRLKLLISAYACRPKEGSEPGIGWNLVNELAKTQQVWVLTRANNQPAIEEALFSQSRQNLKFIYCDLPKWFQYLNRGQKLVHAHYYIWQILAYRLARHLHEEIGFDVVHHVTYVRYWSPSFLSLLPVPFIWGPVGGGETTPRDFWPHLGLRGLVYESLREGIHRFSELDPYLGMTARRSAIALATTKDTAACLERLGSRSVRVFSQLGLSEADLSPLSNLPPPRQPRFISIGRLLHWKGFDLGIKAFAEAQLPPDVSYWIIGDGPERKRLAMLAQDLGVGERVCFLGKLPRHEVLSKLSDCSVLIHPSLHDSGALVCAEAMAAGRPVICLDQGGPALQVSDTTGFKVTPITPRQVVSDLANAMQILTYDEQQWLEMSQASRKRIQTCFSWSEKAQIIINLYHQILDNSTQGVSQNSSLASKD